MQTKNRAPDIHPGRGFLQLDTEVMCCTTAADSAEGIIAPSFLLREKSPIRHRPHDPVHFDPLVILEGHHRSVG